MGGKVDTRGFWYTPLHSDKDAVVFDVSYFDVNYHPTKFENNWNIFWGSTVTPKKSYIFQYGFFEIYFQKIQNVS